MAKIVYGLTHDLEGNPVVRESTTIKIGIGLPKGKDIHVHIDAKRRWVVRVGDERFTAKDMEAARVLYRDKKASAPDRKYPSKLPYFTFSKVSPDGTFEPDFRTIEEHGPLPTEIDIIFLDNEPFDYSYQMWTALEKKCEGNGVDAQRVLSMAVTVDEKSLASEAKERGERTFPIGSGCWLKGCPYAGDACKPHGRLLFQLAKSPRLGASAYFDTTGFRSVGWIFSSLQKVRLMTGHGDAQAGFVAGIPFKMCVRPYAVKYEQNGQKKRGTAYGVWLEYRAEDALSLKHSLLEQAHAYRVAGGYLLGSGEPIEADATDVGEEPALPPPVNAAAMANEFYTNGDDDNGAVLEIEDEPLEPVHTINEDQRREVIAVARAVELPDDQLVPILESHGFNLLADITTDKFGAICEAIRQWQTVETQAPIQRPELIERAIQLEAVLKARLLPAAVEDIIERIAGVREARHLEGGDAAKVIASLEREVKQLERSKKR